jgi:hypothetical protein
MPLSKIQSDILRLLAAHRDPESYNEIRRNARYTDADFRRIASDPPIDPVATMTRFREILSEAETFVARMPTDKAGLLFLKDAHIVQPDPDRLEEYQTHSGKKRGHWPSSPEIAAAMWEHYNKKP